MVCCYDRMCNTVASLRASRKTGIHIMSYSQEFTFLLRRGTGSLPQPLVSVCHSWRRIPSGIERSLMGWLVIDVDGIVSG